MDSGIGRRASLAAGWAAPTARAPQAEAGERLDSIQCLRGLAAGLVFIFHLVVTLDRYSPATLRTSVEAFQIGVDLFFVISGFVMALSVRRLSGPSDAASFLSRRFMRIAPLLYVVTLVYLIQAALYGRTFEAGQVANGLTILPAFETAAIFDYALVPAWTLGFELAFYLLVGLVVAARMRRRLTGLIGLLVSLPALPLVLPAALSPYSSPMMLEFAFGVAAYGLWSRKLISARWAVLAALAGMVVLVVPFAEMRAVRWGVPCGLLFTAALAWRPGTSPLARLALWLGTVSYSMYLSHVVVFDALAPLLRPHMGLGVMALTLGGTGLLAAWWLHDRVEAPLMRIGCKRKAALGG